METNPQTGMHIPGKKVLAQDFYAYRMMLRSDSFNHIFRCRQLFHPYLTDMYAKIESERLLFIRLNQASLRAESCINLRDAVANDGNDSNLAQQRLNT